MTTGIKKAKGLMTASVIAFALSLTSYMAAMATAGEQRTPEELREYYRQMYEKMKQNQEKKQSEAPEKAESKTDEEKKQDANRQKTLELIRKREEARMKAVEDWLKMFHENAAKLTDIDDAPDLSKSPKAPEGMAYIPDGKFMRGQDWGEWTDNQPSQVIYLDPYYIDIYEVTVGKYKDYLNEIKKPVPFPLKAEDVGGDNQPVFKVTWENADAYCKHYGKRLPTEAEWEKAARGWDTRYYPWGNDLPDANKEYRANYAPGLNRGDDGFLYTGDVGSFPAGASPYGAHDMSGNIAEWTADWFDPEYYKVKAGKNPKGPETGTQKSIRGGGYDVPYNNLLLTIRLAAKPNDSNNFTGFRCAMDAD